MYFSQFLLILAHNDKIILAQGNACEWKDICIWMKTRTLITQNIEYECVANDWDDS